MTFIQSLFYIDIFTRYTLFLINSGISNKFYQYIVISITAFMSVQADTNFNYYHEYCRLYLANVVLLSQMREMVNERNQLTNRFSKLQKKGEEIQDGERGQDDKKKRFRRTANEIQRHYRCPIETCQRSYGSEGSLNQHIKIKHPELYDTLNLNRSEAGQGQDSRGTDSLISRKHFK